MALFKKRKNFLFRLDVLLIGIMLLAVISELFSMNSTIYAEQILLDRLINCTNEIRRQNDADPLYLNYQLNEAAYNKLQDMDNYDYWAHYNDVTGTEPWQFIVNAGYEYTVAGENLAIGFFDSIDVCEAWKNSSSHLSNIINPTFQEVGFAIDQVDLGDQGVGVLVVQFFGSREGFIAPTDERAYYNLLCDRDIDPLTKIIQPECEVVNQISPEVMVYNPQSLDLDFQLDDRLFPASVQAEGAYFTAKSKEALPDGRHHLVVSKQSNPEEKGNLEFIVDTEIPEVDIDNVSISINKFDDDSYTYRISVDLGEYSFKFFEKIALKVTNEKDDGLVLVDQKMLQRISDSEYTADFVIPKNQAKKDLTAAVTLLDAAGNNATILTTLPTPKLSSPLFIKLFSAFPLATVSLYRISISFIALFIPIPILLSLRHHKPEYRKLKKTGYFNFIFILAFLGFATITSLFFLP